MHNNAIPITVTPATGGGHCGTFVRAPDDFLTLDELANALRLDPRTVKRVAYALGGKRFGNRWRFKWGTVMEYFSNADFENGQRQSVDGAGGFGRQAGCLQDVSARQEARPGLAGGKRMGGGATQTGRSGPTPRSGGGGDAPDPYGLREALGLGGGVSGPRAPHNGAHNVG